MTNNPTIDGVSLLPCAFCGDPGRTDNGFGLCESIYYAWCTNQECFMSDGVDMGVTSEVWNKRDPHALARHSKRLIEQQQSTIAQLEDKLNKAIDLDFERRETIARLEGKVQELESKQGSEVIHQVRTHGSGCWEDISGESLEMCKCEPEEYEIRKLFTAPPAPVAVGLPNRKTEYVTETQGAYLRGWNACLDATAALSGERK